MRSWLSRLALALAALLLLASMLIVVDADEIVVIFRLGAVQRTATAGLSFRIPLLERAVRVSVTEVRRVEPGRRILLTGDTNLVEVEAVAQFTVRDPVAYLLQLSAPDDLVSGVISAYLAAQVSRMEVDTLLTTGRSALEQQVLSSAQGALDALGAGVQLEAVELRALQPPEAVVAAFNDVSSARGDRDTMVLSAQSYASKQLPDVRGESSQRKEQARTRAAQRVAQARAEVQRFTELLPAWRANPRALGQTLRQQAAQDASPRILLASPGTWISLPPEDARP